MTASPSTVDSSQKCCGSRSLLIAAALFFCTGALFLPAQSNDFVEWDDQMYVYEEPNILNGISLKSLQWALTANVCANWHPLTVFSLQLDAQLFGPGPAGFHRTAIFLHAVNAALAYWAVYALTGCPWRSAFVAALFAWHPTRVESVAWISERKGLLSGTFFFLTLIAYAKYVRSPSIWRYLLVALCLALGLTAKSILVTTPCVLLLLDFWPLQRLKLTSEWISCSWKVVLEKLPLLGLTAIASMMTSVYQSGTMLGEVDSSMGERPENFVRAIAAYLGQTAWPTRLSHFYPFVSHSVNQFFLAVVLLLIISGIAIWQWRQRPYLLIGWLWFLGMLVPVSGLIQVGFQQRADRYLYLSQFGLFLGVVWGISDLAQPSRVAKAAATVVLVIFLVACGTLTVKQIDVWKNTNTLWQQAYECDPGSPPALFYQMNHAFDEGRPNDAVRFADELIQIEDRKRHQFLSRVYEALVVHGEYEASLRAIDRLLSFGGDAGPPPQELYFHRGESYAALGRWSESVQDYQHMLKLAPQVVPLWFCLAHAMEKNGQLEESRQLNAAALQRFPQFPESAVTSAWKTCTDSKSPPNQLFKAMCLAEHANTLTGGKQARYLDVLAAAYAANGQFDQAVTTAKLALLSVEHGDQSIPADDIRNRLELYEHHQRYLLEAPAQMEHGPRDDGLR